MLKKIFLSFFLLFSFVVYAEKEQDIKEIEIRLRNGQKNKDGTTTYKTVVTRLNDGKLFISCSEPGDNKCSATVDVIVTAVLPVVDSMVETEITTAIDIMKREILNGKTNSRFMIGNSIYTFNDGVLLSNGTFEFSMRGVLDQSIIK
jgi:hypothetical protein